MEPSSNRWRVKEALLSLLAGDIFRGTSYGLRVAAFKALYYLHSLLQPRQSWRAWRTRRQVVQSA
jgi:hypothetical protein